jgi:hypothetical protein
MILAKQLSQQVMACDPAWTLPQMSDITTNMGMKVYMKTLESCINFMSSHANQGQNNTCARRHAVTSNKYLTGH